jgi:hypothetical protein
VRGLNKKSDKQQKHKKDLDFEFLNDLNNDLANEGILERGSPIR